MISETLTDQELALLIKKGDIRAFDKIYEKYSTRLYIFINGIIKSQKDSEDIVQEVFFKIWNNREKINEFLSLQSFLFTIAHNTTISILRKRVNEYNYIEYVKSIQNAKELSTGEAELEFKELNDHLTSILNKLPKRQKEVFLLSRYDELSYKEIAERLGISVNTVENHMVKALRFLRANIKSTSFVSALFSAFFL
jgi:RNA polymerase sigma-70 factor (ECF subfamily)